MHMVCLVGDKQIDKWLCGECAKDYMPMGMGGMPLTPEGAKRFIDELLKSGKATVRVLETKDKWFGVTYKEDKQSVVDSFKKLIADGVYNEKLFS